MMCVYCQEEAARLFLKPYVDEIIFLPVHISRERNIPPPRLGCLRINYATQTLRI